MELSTHTCLLLVSHAMNHAFKAGFFDPSGPNYHPAANPPPEHKFRSMLGDIPVIAFFRDWSFDEVKCHVAAYPTDDAEECINVCNANARAGEIFTSVFIERPAELHIPGVLDERPYVQAQHWPMLRTLRRPSKEEDPLGLYPFYLSSQP